MITDERLEALIDILSNGWERDGDTEDEMSSAISDYKSLRAMLAKAGLHELIEHHDFQAKHASTRYLGDLHDRYRTKLRALAAYSPVGE